MLPPFHIRNLQPSRLPDVSRDTRVRISAPCYDQTISSHPEATLKYHDEEDGDLITLGSSIELAQKLEEPVLLPVAGVPVSLQHPFENHVFEIDDRDNVRKLWQDIKDSKDASIAQDLDNTKSWSVEKKDCLAIFYERQRHKIWSPIAEELGMTWQSVDAMHWSLGREEMARRALKLVPRPGNFGGSQEIIDTKPESTYDTATPQFEEYRAKHFNATRPSQLHLPGSVTVTTQPFGATAGQATIANVSAVDLSCSASSVTDNNEAADPPMGSKRQAQSAGDKIQSGMTVADSHQNRWANHKPFTSAFFHRPSSSPSLAFDGPGLTSEGKRQAQAAGDKLRCRTSPIRHPKPSWAGDLEHGISKNRWSSYSGTRAARFDERQDAQDVAKVHSNIADNGEMHRNDQPSLLEVFETELARKSLAKDKKDPTAIESSAVRSLLPEAAMQIDPSRESRGQPLPQRPQALLGFINELLQELTDRDRALSQDFSLAIDHGFRTAGAAASGLSACIHSIARGLQEVSTISRQAVGRTRHGDLQFIDEAFLRFQSLASGFTAASRREMAANRPASTSISRSRSEEVENSSFTSLGISQYKEHEEDANSADESNRSPLNGSDNPSQLADTLGRINIATARSIFEKPASTQLKTESKSDSGVNNPAPVPFPNRPGYVNRLRQSQSTRSVDHQHNLQGTDSPRLDSYVPNFGGESFRPASTFPALPSMEPLVPQRAPYQSSYGPTAGESGSANGSSPLASNSRSADTYCRFDDLVIGRHKQSAESNGHEAVPLGRLSSAARLAGPFDPSEAEPSALSQLTEGLSRNATTACTDVKNIARCARPYSVAFDGSRRVPWSTFLQTNDRERKSLHGASGNRGGLLDADQEHARRLPRPEAASRRPPVAAALYDYQHHDDSTVDKINDCVERLRDLGFGGEDIDSASRLLIYAQAADGVLVDAIHLIDEEQRAWQRL